MIEHLLQWASTQEEGEGNFREIGIPLITIIVILYVRVYEYLGRDRSQPKDDQEEEQIVG